MAQNLDQIILFRLLQGAFGAALGPLSQTIMMDMFPPQSRGSVMGVWGMGVMLGPILGPTLGGYLTDAFSWRWVFYINVPVGIAAVIGLWLFYRDPGRDQSLVFDWFGFSLLALGLGALQLMLDRGTHKDWFNSIEIVVEGVVALLGLYLFAVHMATAEKPFIRLEIFKDRNFTSATLLMFVTGGLSGVEFGTARAVPANVGRLFGHGRGLADGAARRWHDVGDVDGRPRRDALRRAQGHHARRNRAAADDVRDVALDAGGHRIDDGLGRLHPGLRHGLHLRADESHRVFDDPGARSAPMRPRS